MDVKTCYAAMGADYEDVMYRFRNEERVKKFLGMFLRDQCFASFEEAMAAGDYGEAFRASHTIKGISMNLSLTVLAESSGAVTEALRAGSPTEDIGPQAARMETDYKNAVAAIRECLEG